MRRSDWGPIYPHSESSAPRASIASVDEEGADEKLLILKNPEAKLFFTIILHALFDAIRANKLIRKSARAWIASDSAEEFSLIWYARQISPQPEGLIRYCRKFVKDHPKPETNGRKLRRVE